MSKAKGVRKADDLMRKLVAVPKSEVEAWLEIIDKEALRRELSEERSATLPPHQR